MRVVNLNAYDNIAGTRPYSQFYSQRYIRPFEMENTILWFSDLKRKELYAYN